MIGGRMVLSGRRFTSFDYAALQAEAQAANTRLRQLNRDSRLRSDAAAEFVSRYCIGLTCRHYHVQRRLDPDGRSG